MGTLVCKPCYLLVWLHARLLQWCPTLWDPMDCSPPSSSVHGVLQARKLGWVAISFSRGSSRPRNWTHISYVSCIAAGSLPQAPPGKPLLPTCCVSKYPLIQELWDLDDLSLPLFPTHCLPKSPWAGRTQPHCRKKTIFFLPIPPTSSFLLFFQCLHFCILPRSMYWLLPVFALFINKIALFCPLWLAFLC